MFFLQIIELLLILFILPLMMGQLFRKKEDGLLITTVYGYFIEWCVLYIAAIPIIVNRGKLSTIMYICEAVYLVLAALGIIRWKRTKRERLEIPSLTKSECIYLGVFIALFLFQVYKSIFYAFADGDDSYYLSVGLYSSISNNMYTTDAYIGSPGVMLYRYALAPFPMWSAAIARFSGVHATVLSQTILSPVLVGVSYIIYNAIAKQIFGEDKEKRYMLLCLVAVFEMFSNGSTCTQGTFMLTRARQGKEALACIALPMVFLEIFRLIKNECEFTARDYFALISMGISAALMSIFGNILFGGMIAFLGLYILVKRKGFKKLFFTASIVVPNLISVLLYYIYR